MGDHFKVEVEDLDRLLKQLHSSQDDMRSALNALKEVGPKSTGSEALDNACDEFHDSWDNAITKIADGTGQIEEKLKATKKNYEATEQAIRDALTKGGAKPSAGPTPTAGAR
ncbi:WXG100 family type VII secretion target [Streptomyces sp. HB2AG]|uniref:WXG100 family type VII secretion target n=1 Tax=Streptomyces sp. HB2AG TaxID=2983400 RepID=UPI0022AA2D83|nr:type VII secretion target [Streptomyces sp. HB2AG]MCZ2524854.1 type VII secretion target [Streptomyces sp. HB2AG]